MTGDGHRVDDRLLTEALSRLVQVVAAGGSADEVVRELCEATAAVVLDGRRAHVLVDPVVRPDELVAPVATTGLTRLQQLVEVGPSRACATSLDSMTVVAGRTAIAGAPWPEMRAAAVRADVGLVVLVPLVGDGHRGWGVLQVLVPTDAPWSEHHLEAVVALCGVAALGVAAAAHHDVAAVASAELAAAEGRDPLTGLPDRVELVDRVETALADPAAQRVGVAILDVLGLRALRSQLGLRSGDALMRETALRAWGALTGNETFGRWSGSELMVVVTGLPDDVVLATSELSELALRLGAAATRVVTLPDGRSVAVRTAVGIALADRGSDLASLVNAAEATVRRT
ncbi:MAG: diguanylate cyclase [Nocardioidaceae bacterium]|nr:diguanylate cyclase [Nocardioidaceae bacterium]